MASTASSSNTRSSPYASAAPSCDNSTNNTIDDDDDSKTVRCLITNSCHGFLEPSCLGRTSEATSPVPKGKAPPNQNRDRHLRAASTHVRSGHEQSKINNNNNNNNPRQGGGLARQKRHSWMRSSVVRRAAAVVDEEVAALCEKSPFLNSVASSSVLLASEMALFRRSEIQLGKALGRGGFAEVYAVARFELQQQTDDDDNDNSNDNSSSPQAERRRRQMQATVSSHTATSSSRPVYAIKFLCKKLLSNTREFQHAAIDLAVEAQYLAALQQSPYIVKVHGLTQGGTAAFRTGKHDEYFIIMDYLHETLDYRIQRWNRRHSYYCPNVPPSSKQQQQDDHEQDEHYSQPHPNDHDHHCHPPQLQYFPRTLKYAHQIANALNYLHDKQIVYRDLKPQNIGFKERDTIQIFDFGLCRELPKPKGQAHREEDLEDEETFHMSGVGTQRYMAPEIIMTRRYNLKADVYSWSMVAFEMMTWNKPFAEYNPDEHQLNVAQRGERPRLLTRIEWEQGLDTTTTSRKAQEGVKLHHAEQRKDDHLDEVLQPKAKRKRANAVAVDHWPVGLTDLLQEAWTQDVGDRLTIQSVLERIGSIAVDVAADVATSSKPLAGKEEHGFSVESGVSPQEGLRNTAYDTEHNADPGYQDEFILEFPSHFSPIHAMSGHSRHEQYRKQQQQQQGQQEHEHNQQQDTAGQSLTRDDSDRWFGDRQSDASNSLLELTMTSASTTMHDSHSTNSLSATTANRN